MTTKQTIGKHTIGLRAAALAMLAWWAIGGAAAQAQSLQEAMTLAYESNPSLLAERARLRATDENWVQARAGGLPQVNAGASTTIQDSRSQRTVQGLLGASEVESSDTNDFSSISVDASQQIYRGGRTRAAMDQARGAIEAGRANLAALEQSVLFDVVVAYTDAARDQEVVVIRQNNVEVLNRQLEAARDRFEVGEITRTDVAQAEARLSRARGDLEQARAQLAVSRAAFTRVVGQEPAALQPPPPIPPTPGSPDEAAERAVADNPQVIAARFSEETARAAVRDAQGAFRPTVALQASADLSRSYMTSASEGESISIGARASVPLFTSGLNASRLRQARENENRARFLVRDAARQVEEVAVAAWAAYISAQNQITAARDQIAAAEIAFEGVEEEARVGLRTTLDVLNAEQELLNARLTLVFAERDAYVAGHRLLQAVGRLTAADMGLGVAAYDAASNFEDLEARRVFTTGGVLDGVF